MAGFQDDGPMAATTLAFRSTGQPWLAGASRVYFAMYAVHVRDKRVACPTPQAIQGQFPFQHHMFLELGYRSCPIAASLIR